MLTIVVLVAAAVLVLYLVTFVVMFMNRRRVETVTCHRCGVERRTTFAKGADRMSSSLIHGDVTSRTYVFPLNDDPDQVGLCRSMGHDWPQS